MDVPAILRRARLRSGLSLRELAARADTSHSALAAYESARVTPNVETFDGVGGVVWSSVLQSANRSGLGVHGSKLSLPGATRSSVVPNWVNPPELKLAMLSFSQPP